MTFPVYPGSNPSGYNLTRSLRFRAYVNSYLTRTMSTPTNNKIWTISTWVKRGALSSGALQSLFVANAGGAAYWGLSFLTTDQLYIFDGYNATSTLQTSAVYRDSSSWYHIVVAVDTTQATASNRFKLYVNGSQVIAFSTATYPNQNLNTQWNTASQSCSIGRDQANGRYFDGYMAETYFVDGQALTPASFGSTNATTGVWQPAPYSGGSYGTNGFYLPFTDNSALTTSSNVGLGKDFSGNGNYWATNNISITPGIFNDSVTDVPTLTNATTSNFAVLNPLNSYPGALIYANLVAYHTNAFWASSVGSIYVNSGKWYAEFTISNAGSNSMVGLADLNFQGTVQNYAGFSAASYGYFNAGTKWNNNVGTAYGASFTTNDVIGIALDLTAGTLTFYKNNVSQGVAFSGLSGFFTFVAGSYASASVGMNFGQQPFIYTPPTGHLAINTYNLPNSAIVKGNTVMDATLYTGTGAIQSITNAAGFKPDLLWVKARSRTSAHDLVDSVRGVNLALTSNSTQAEITGSFITSLNSNGFTLPANTLSDTYFTNVSGDTLVGWQWQAGQGTTSTNTSGTITSTVSVNASAGFSVVTYTGNGIASQTVGHGLGVAPAMVIVKSRSSVVDWVVHHQSLVTPANDFLLLNSSNSVGVVSNWFSKSSSTIGFPTTYSSTNVNGQTQVAYCWSQISGFSSFGSYTGNGSTAGPFVYLGFRPAFVMVKATSTTSNWSIMDNKRPAPYNSIPASGLLYPNLTNAEGGTGDWIDFLSNGFKIVNPYGDSNSSGVTYIYMAFAENPFKNSLAR